MVSFECPPGVIQCPPGCPGQNCNPVVKGCPPCQPNSAPQTINGGQTLWGLPTTSSVRSYLSQFLPHPLSQALIILVVIWKLLAERADWKLIGIWVGTGISLLLYHVYNPFENFPSKSVWSPKSIFNQTVKSTGESSQDIRKRIQETRFKRAQQGNQQPAPSQQGADVLVAAVSKDKLVTRIQKFFDASLLDAAVTVLSAEEGSPALSSQTLQNINSAGVVLVCMTPESLESAAFRLLVEELTRKVNYSFIPLIQEDRDWTQCTLKSKDWEKLSREARTMLTISRANTVASQLGETDFEDLMMRVVQPVGKLKGLSQTEMYQRPKKKVGILKRATKQTISKRVEPSSLQESFSHTKDGKAFKRGMSCRAPEDLRKMAEELLQAHAVAKGG